MSYAQAKEEWKIGQEIAGFRLQKVQPVAEINCTALLFEHKKSGARLMKLLTDDDNKTFNITFATFPSDDTGVPHILEHSVLAGSRKFPVKDPFMVLVKGSLNTFLNAMTSSDFTMYPVASRNRKDFFNLMDVYLDAVFYPHIYQEKKIFLQEGWRYELADENSPLEINGIVYNEMKGAYSAPERVMEYLVNRELFPQNTYGYSSGGYPDSIPQLSYEKFLDFHRRFYHPSNAFITVYGDGDTREELAFIDGYLKDFSRQPLKETVKVQPPFEKLHSVEGEYPVAEGEQTAQKTYLSLSFAAGGCEDDNLAAALDVLSEVLVNLPAAPVRKALQEAGIGMDVYAYYDAAKQGVWSLVVKNAEAAQAETFKQVVFDTMKKLAQSGIDKKDIEGVINRLEFRLREADYGSFPKGLVYTYMSARRWIFGGDPLPALQYEKVLAYLKQALKEPLLEKLLEKYLLNNPHGVLAVVKPVPGLESKKVEALKARLVEEKKKLGPVQIKQIVEQSAELKRWQTMPDKPEDLAKIPMLKLADLDRKAEELKTVEKSVSGVRVLHSPQTTNGIVYLQLLFDASVVPEEMLPLLPVLAHVLGELRTDKYDYGELNTELNIHTGGLGFSISTYPREGQPEQFQPKLEVYGKALVPKADKLTELAVEILLHTRFDDRDRLEKVLGELRSRLEDMARGAGQALASQRLGSYITPLGKFGELTAGLSYIKFVNGVLDKFDAGAADLIADLQMLSALIMNRNGLILGVTCSEEDFAAVEKSLAALVNTFPANPLKVQPLSFEPQTTSEALLSASKVQYVVMGADLRRLGYQYDGRYEILQHVLGSDYLTQEIRIKGGAYGAWASFSRTGSGLLASYRDPNLERTIEVMKNSVHYLENFSASDDEMDRFVIGTIARLDRPKTPSMKGREAIADFLRGIDYQKRQAERDQVLGTRQTDLKQMAEMLKKLLENASLCVYGNQKLLEEKSSLFKLVTNVID